jgi:hypothetical protein
MIWYPSPSRSEAISEAGKSHNVYSTYPEINIEVTCAAKLAIADLEGDRHLVIPVQGLVEALEAMGRQDNVVRGGSLKGDSRSEECPRGR